ncbi:hypothetical protein WDV06_14800 [Streptomyces racemochromogenes]|uniref:Uncharacterized protein n=1 Tax=Streptomyces racemochromogenes TaxID=67353 RepID=A0ABW7PE89_9ACTN
MDALHAFLLGRIGRLLAAHPPRTEEHRAADALRRAVETTWGDLEDCYAFLHRGQEGMEAELGETWDRMRLGLSWNDAPDYDASLWPPIRYAHLLFTTTPADQEETPSR